MSRQSLATVSWQHYLAPARKTEVGSAVSSAAALSCGETFSGDLKLDREILLFIKLDREQKAIENLVDEADPSLVSGLDPGPP